MKRKRILWDGGAADVSTENNGKSKLEYAGPIERWSMEFVHDTLADGRPCRVLTVEDHWSWQSQVLKVGGWMTGVTVSQILERGLSEGQHSRPITVDMGPHFNRERWKRGPIGALSSSTSFVPANRSKIPPFSYAPLDERFQ